MFGTIREQIDTVFRADPAARSRLEIVLCYPGFHAIMFHRLTHQIYNAKWYTLARLISQISAASQGLKFIRGLASGGASLSITEWVW